jgi:uncharacterized protein (TIGR02569 family)
MDLGGASDCCVDARRVFTRWLLVALGGTLPAMCTANDETSDAIRRVLARHFGVDRPVRLLPGGEGRTYRAGDHIFRRETNPAEACFIADLYSSMEEQGFRLPRPARALDGAWVTPQGWSAWTFVEGQPATTQDLAQVIPAIQAFHRALASVPYPPYLARRDSPYDRANLQTWEDAPLTLEDRFAPLVVPLLQRRRPVPELRAQLIHADLNEQNILVASGSDPAIIDMTPYWRPPEFAVAVLAYWLGPYRNNPAILPAFAHIREFDQMLLRVGLRTLLISQEFSRLGAAIGDVEQEYRGAVEIICRWVDRVEARR